MNYIDRYVYAVKKHLPASQKEDVGNEIRTLILEQVSEEDDFEKIEKVLKSLGSPRKLAYQYRSQDRYLIGPDHFEFYFDILKIALYIFVGLSIALSLFSGVTRLFSEEAISASFFFELVFENLIGDAITTALITFALVTIGYIAAIHFKWLDENDEWLLKDLPDLPNRKVDDSFDFRGHLINTIGLAVGFTFLVLVLRLPWLAFGGGDDFSIVTPANYDTYFPIFLGLIGYFVLTRILYLRAQRLTQLIFALRILLSLAIIITIGLMFFGNQVFLTSQDITTLANLFEVNPVRIENQINIILGAILLSIVIGRSYDAFMDIKELKKNP